MTIPVEQHPWLRDAMTHLIAGDSRKFCDTLWLGFGDQWQDVLEALVKGGQIATSPRSVLEEIRITDRGRAMARELQERRAG